MTTFILSVIALSAVAVVIVLGVIADYLRNTMKDLKDSIDEQNYIFEKYIGDLRKELHRANTNIGDHFTNLRKELHRANTIAIVQHLIDDWDKIKWREVFDLHTETPYSDDKNFFEHNKTESNE